MKLPSNVSGDLFSSTKLKLFCFLHRPLRDTVFSGLALRDSTDQVGCLSKTDSSVHVPREFLFFKSSAAGREREINPSVVVRISSSLTTLSCNIFFLFFFSFNFAHFNFRIKNIFHALAQSTTVVRQDVSHEYVIINNSNNNSTNPGS